MNAIETKLSNLFKELVPDTGKADTVAGEIVRAVNRIAYRNWNDGDHIGVAYGKETCNTPARYLADTCGGGVALAVNEAWGIVLDDMYNAALGDLEAEVLGYIEENPDLKNQPNNCDMWDYFDKDEDRDDSWDDEDEEEDYDEEEEY